jgi:hypothetical protein
VPAVHREQEDEEFEGAGDWGDEEAWGDEDEWGDEDGVATRTGQGKARRGRLTGEGERGDGGLRPMEIETHPRGEGD